MAITFGGLATGLDTNAIISELMKIERQPITRLENDRNFFNSRLQVFKDLDGLLGGLQTKAEAIDTAAEIDSPGLKQSSDLYYSATATGTAGLGSYQIEVMALAQVQKDVSGGYADKTTSTFGTGTMSLTVGGTPTSITIDATNNSLDGIAKAINDAATGVTATVINDGTASPYRLVLSGDSVDKTFTLDASGLTGGTDVNPTMTNTQAAQQAHIQVDNIDIYSNSNTVADAIPGVTIDLLKADAAVATTLSVSVDQDATKTKIQGFVDAYNAIVTHISAQKDADWGNDAGFRSVKRGLQSLLTTSVSGLSGSYSSLAELGFETQKDGTLVLNSATLTKAMDNDYEGMVAVFAGETGVDGISKKFADLLTGMTDTADGLLASKQKSTDDTISRIDDRIVRLEARLVIREKTLRSQFSAMEALVSAMNSQSAFLSQQMTSLSSMNKR